MYTVMHLCARTDLQTGIPYPHTKHTLWECKKKKGEKKGSQGLGNVLILSVVCGLEKAYDMKMFPELLC